jgi:prepilin-type N-terminal cleavage/methylation domain-containing protein
MVRRQKAFTLIELMIVVAIIAIIAAIAIPSLISSRIASYETAAQGTLRSLAAAETTFVTRCIVDQDGDGSGEYGFLQELTGYAIPRGRAAMLPAGEGISSALGKVDANGISSKSGYCFQLWLPTDAGVAETEGPAGTVPAASATDANVQETRWACYSWPVDHGSTGYRCFVVNQQAEVYQARNDDGAGAALYDGTGTAPPPEAALDPAGVATTNLDGNFPPSGTVSEDGQQWAQSSGGG